MKLRRSLTKDASYRSAFAAFRRVPGLDDAEASLFASFHAATPSERWLRNQSCLQLHGLLRPSKPTASA